MRYTEQLKYSWNYNCGIFREIWDALTLRKKHWWVVLALVVLCVVPEMILVATAVDSDVAYFATNRVPAPNMRLPQDIVPRYYWEARGNPPLLLLFDYYWVKSEGFNPLTTGLCLVSAGLLLCAWLREE